MVRRLDFHFLLFTKYLITLNLSFLICKSAYIYIGIFSTCAVTSIALNTRNRVVEAHLCPAGSLAASSSSGNQKCLQMLLNVPEGRIAPHLRITDSNSRSVKLVSVEERKPVWCTRRWRVSQIKAAFGCRHKSVS